MKMIFRDVLCMIAILFYGLCQAQPASGCLSISEEGNSSIWKNTCSESISVAYCSTAKPIWGRRCGEGTNSNVYFTHMATLKAGEKKSNGKDLKTAACKGQLNAWDIKDSFTSDSQGRFDCYDPGIIRKTGVVPMLSRASGSTEDDACKNAHKLAGIGASTATCICKAAGRLHICQVTTLEEKPPAAISLKNSTNRYIREKLQCASDDAECLKERSKKNNGGSGIR